jgi:hypothetical protein
MGIMENRQVLWEKNEWRHFTGISGGKFPLSKCPLNTLRNFCSCFMCEQGSRDHRAGGFLSSIVLLSILSKPGYLQGTSLKVMNYLELTPFFWGVCKQASPLAHSSI